MDKFEKRRLRLIRLRDERCGGSNSTLARRIDKDPSYVSRLLYEEGKAGKKRVTENILEAIELAFGIHRSWMDKDDSDLEHPSCTESMHLDDEGIPLLLWDNIGGPESSEQLKSSFILPTRYIKSKNTFALQVRGDSMEPIFFDGSIIIVEPDARPNHGDYVVAKTDKHSSATFKQLIKDGGFSFLKPINPRYPLIEMNDEFIICGVVKRVQKDF